MKCPLCNVEIGDFPHYGIPNLGAVCYEHWLLSYNGAGNRLVERDLERIREADPEHKYPSENEETVKI
jgi:hypothetical protein